MAAAAAASAASFSLLTGTDGGFTPGMKNDKSNCRAFVGEILDPPVVAATANDDDVDVDVDVDEADDVDDDDDKNEDDDDDDDGANGLYILF
jgi:hypothetical protein